MANHLFAAKGINYYTIFYTYKGVLTPLYNCRTIACNIKKNNMPCVMYAEFNTCYFSSCIRFMLFILLMYRYR
jgi:hypothetical protein